MEGRRERTVVISLVFTNFEKEPRFSAIVTLTINITIIIIIIIIISHNFD